MGNNIINRGSIIILAMALPFMLALNAFGQYMGSGSHKPAIGAEIAFQINYGALLRAMGSRFVAKIVLPHRAGIS